MRHVRRHTLKNPTDASKWRSPAWTLTLIFSHPKIAQTIPLVFSSFPRGLCDPTQRRNEHSASLVIQFPFGVFLLCRASFWHFGGQQFCSKYYICPCWRHVPLYFSGGYGKKFLKFYFNLKFRIKHLGYASTKGNLLLPTVRKFCCNLKHSWFNRQLVLAVI